MLLTLHIHTLSGSTVFTQSLAVATKDFIPSGRKTTIGEGPLLKRSVYIAKIAKCYKTNQVLDFFRLTDLYQTYFCFHIQPPLLFLYDGCGKKWQ